jgi:hypothetical protein
VPLNPVKFKFLTEVPEALAVKVTVPVPAVMLKLILLASVGTLAVIDLEVALEFVRLITGVPVTVYPGLSLPSALNTVPVPAREIF